MTTMQPVSTSFSTAPEYAIDVSGRAVAVLQHLQTAMGQWHHPTQITLADVHHLLAQLETQFGAETTLEVMIQFFAGQALKQQILCRKQSASGVAEGVAA